MSLTAGSVILSHGRVEQWEVAWVLDCLVVTLIVALNKTVVCAAGRENNLLLSLMKGCCLPAPGMLPWLHRSTVGG